MVCIFCLIISPKVVTFGVLRSSFATATPDADFSPQKAIERGLVLGLRAFYGSSGDFPLEVTDVITDFLLQPSGQDRE